MDGKRLDVAIDLGLFFPGVHFEYYGEKYVAEFGGELPAVLVDSVRRNGATVDLYRHKGVVSTVVSF